MQSYSRRGEETTTTKKTQNKKEEPLRIAADRRAPQDRKP